MMKDRPKKAAKQKARERNADIRDAYCHYNSDFFAPVISFTETSPGITKGYRAVLRH
jgi:hypothetical protein